MTNLNALYKEHKNMICERAWSFHRTTGHPVDELTSQGNLLFMQAALRWDSMKSNFSSWLYQFLTKKLCDYVRKNSIASTSEEIREGSQHLTALEHLEFQEAIKALSAEAGYVAQIVLDGPTEVLEIIGTESPKAVRGAIKDFLREQGWSWPKIWNSFKEIKAMLINLTIERSTR